MFRARNMIRSVNLLFTLTGDPARVALFPEICPWPAAV